MLSHLIVRAGNILCVLDLENCTFREFCPASVTGWYRQPPPPPPPPPLPMDGEPRANAV